MGTSARRQKKASDQPRSATSAANDSPSRKRRVPSRPKSSIAGESVPETPTPDTGRSDAPAPAAGLTDAEVSEEGDVEPVRRRGRMKCVKDARGALRGPMDRSRRRPGRGRVVRRSTRSNSGSRKARAPQATPRRQSLPSAAGEPDNLEAGPATPEDLSHRNTTDVASAGETTPEVDPGPWPEAARQPPTRRRVARAWRRAATAATRTCVGPGSRAPGASRPGRAAAGTPRPAERAGPPRTRRPRHSQPILIRPGRSRRATAHSELDDWPWELPAARVAALPERPGKRVGRGGYPPPADGRRLRFSVSRPASSSPLSLPLSGRAERPSRRWGWQPPRTCPRRRTRPCKRDARGDVRRTTDRTACLGADWVVSGG